MQQLQLVRTRPGPRPRTVAPPPQSSQGSPNSRHPLIAPFSSKTMSPDQQHMLTPQKIEKKRLEYEKIREQRRLFDAEMAKHEAELSLMLEEHGRLSGHQSEPTTPPEYRETTTGFPSVFSRPNRYSLSSLTSPHGMANRSARSGSVLTSPQSGIPLSRFAFDDQLPSWSHTTSRRNSDDDEKEEAVRQDPTSHRSTNAYVGLSVPVSYFLELCARVSCCFVICWICAASWMFPPAMCRLTESHPQAAVMRRQSGLTSARLNLDALSWKWPLQAVGTQDVCSLVCSNFEVAVNGSLIPFFCHPRPTKFHCPTLDPIQTYSESYPRYPVVHFLLLKTFERYCSLVTSGLKRPGIPRSYAIRRTGGYWIEYEYSHQVCGSPAFMTLMFCLNCQIRNPQFPSCLFPLPHSLNFLCLSDRPTTFLPVFPSTRLLFLSHRSNFLLSLFCHLTCQRFIFPFVQPTTSDTSCIASDQHCLPAAILCRASSHTILMTVSDRCTNFLRHSVNRYSMPVTKSRTGFYDIGLDQANTTGFLFGDDDSTPEAKLYTQTNTDDNFPTLVRREPNMVSCDP